jgi:hydroxymethylpyrimidine pyrophosphatase-like HAD family hydrolase
MSFKLFATDLDGTLLDRSGAIHPTDRRAIAELVRRGVPVTILTGRMFSGTRDIARALELDGPVGCLDGCAIVAVQDDRYLVSSALAAQAGRLVQEALARVSPAVFLLARDQIFHDARGVPFAQYLHGWTPRLTPVDDVSAALHWNDGGGVGGVIAVATREEIESLVAALTPAASLVAPRVFPVRREEPAGPYAVLIQPAGVSKGSALQWIAAHHGIAPSEVVAVGDWVNDVPMFAAAGLSFAMGHATDDVKAAATECLRADVTTGGGIAEAAERAGLL